MRRLLPGLTLLLAALAFGLWAMPHLPPRVVSHWDIHGQPNGTMSRTMAALFVPIFGAVLALVFAVLPRIDPRREHLLHAGVWWTLGNAVLILLAVVQVGVLGYNLGWPIPISSVALGSAGLLFILIGYLMPRMRSNWFMGIRTPWTLSSDVVWQRTHALGGRVFAAAGAVAVVLAFMQPPNMFTLLAVVVAIAVLIPVAYSYVLWRHERERGTSGTSA